MDTLKTELFEKYTVVVIPIVFIDPPYKVNTMSFNDNNLDSGIPIFTNSSAILL